MAESMDDKLARAFAVMDLKLETIDKKLGGTYEWRQDVLNKLAAIERRLKAIEDKLPKT
jgi:hypothetical protein